MERALRRRRLCTRALAMQCDAWLSDAARRRRRRRQPRGPAVIYTAAQGLRGCSPEGGRGEDCPRLGAWARQL
eukprot:1709152-Pyramimonas_sp.AAC.1